ncbi:MAG: VCBS repeat-containing protein, partial [Myxococcota bacterium]|nr:VCBS repeat-containing protein [Myxococcota bacterium]
LDLDGATDMITVEDDELHVVRWDGEGYQNQGFTGTGDAGPAAAGPWVPGDALPAVAIVTDAVTLHRGTANADSGAWTRDRFDWRAYNTALLAPGLVEDVNGDGVGDIIGFTTDPGLVLAAWQLSQGAEGQWQIVLGGKAELEGGDPLALAKCGRNLYALTGPEDAATLTRMRLRQDGATWQPVFITSIPAAGSLLACGTVDTGNPGVVVADTSGLWTSYAEGLGERGSGSVGATGAIAIADTDGDGRGEIVGCGAEACSVVAGDLDGDGLDEVVRVADDIRIAWGDSEQVFPGTGIASLGDADGDGNPDILVHDPTTGRVQLLRTAGGSVSWPGGWQTERPLAGPAGLVDMTGDGVPEVVLSDAEGRVLHTGETDPAGSGW